MNIFIIFVVFTYFSVNIRAELKLLSVVFRHGDRAPDSNGLEAYPKVPYANATFFPEGPGGLINAGKMREYHLGQFLRQRYDTFLGPTYYKGSVSARSTAVERARHSLELVLASLYPPEGKQKWNDELDWQPIATTYIPQLDDVLMDPLECPKFLVELERVSESEEFQKQLDQLRPLMKNLTIETGKVFNTTYDIFLLYHYLSSIEAMNLELPNWTKGIFPYGQLYDGTILQYKLNSYNDELNRLNGGMLLRKITDDMMKACNDELDQPRKIFLYSGHEYNVAAVLQSLNSYKPHVPRYSSAVIVELHQENDECFVKVKYYRGLIESSDEDKSIFKDIDIPGCSTESTLQEFIDVLKYHIATDDDVTSCDKRSIPEIANTLKYIPSSVYNWILDSTKKEKENHSKLI